MIPFLKQLAPHSTVLILLLVILLVGFFAHRHDRNASFEEYALAGKSLPTTVLVMTLLATFIGSGELLIPNFIAQYGLAFVCIHIFFIIFTFVCIGTFLTPYLMYFRDCITMGDLMGQFYGPSAQVTTGVVGCITSFIIIMSQLRAVGRVAAYLLGIDHAFSILFFGSLFVLYSVRGGMRAISYTDILQTVMMLCVFGWITKTALEQVGSVMSIKKGLAIYQHEKLGFSELLLLIKGLSFWDLSCAFCLALPIFQRMLMVASKRQARKMWYLSASFYSLFLLMMVLMTLAGVVLLQGEIEKALAAKQDAKAVYGDFFLRLIKKLFGGHNMVMDFIFVGVLGMLLSTADSFLHALGISILHDLVEPMHKFWRGKPFSWKRKSMYARLTVALSGLLALGVSAWQGVVLWDMEMQAYVVFLSQIVLVPLLIGLLGIKTHPSSFFSFMGVYGMSLVGFMWGGWKSYDYFWIAVCSGVVGYFVAHVMKYQGFVTLTRHKYTTSEQIWISPKLRIGTWLGNLLELPKLSTKKLFSCPPPNPLVFSFTVFTLYMIECVMTIGDSYCHIDHFISIVHSIGILLCIGCMLEWSWPARWRPYYALYWFFTVFYCLPFSGTLNFLRAHECTWEVVQWLTMFMLLSFLVDTSLFVLLGLSGMVLAGACYGMTQQLPQEMLGQTGAVGIYGMVLIWVFVLLFQRKKEKYLHEKLYWNRITTSNLAHEITNPLQMLQGIGNVLRAAFIEGKRVKDPTGGKGFFIQEHQYLFLHRFSKRIVEKSIEAQQDLNHFTKFIEQQILGIFEEYSVSIHAYVKEGIRRVSAQYLDKITVELKCNEDFKAKVLSSVFPNVITSLVGNAYQHGRASVVEVKVEGKKRRVYVRDNGQGIPPEIFPHIFDIHYTECRMNNAGLAFARMVIEASGGKISCYSKYQEKDSFTEFIIDLP